MNARLIKKTYRVKLTTDKRTFTQIEEAYHEEDAINHVRAWLYSHERVIAQEATLVDESPSREQVIASLREVIAKELQRQYDQGNEDKTDISSIGWFSIMRKPDGTVDYIAIDGNPDLTEIANAIVAWLRD